MVFFFVLLIASLTSYADSSLINGEPLAQLEWPNSVYARSGNSACSSTIVGEKVLLSAGHCMSNGGSVTFSKNSINYSAKCTHHPDYRSNSTADWSLCLIDKSVEGGEYEVVESEGSFLQVGSEVFLTGFGCLSSSGGGNDGVFRGGKARVTGLPTNGNHDTTTKGGAALCYGDSGGSAYRLTADNKRFVFGVNSRGDIKQFSYLPSTYLPTFHSFAKSWVQTNSAPICGVSSDAKNCRKAMPPVPRNFTMESTKVKIWVTLGIDSKLTTDETKSGLNAALESIK